MDELEWYSLRWPMAQTARWRGMDKSAWFRLGYECLDGFEWLEAKVAERVLDARLIDRNMIVDDDGVSGLARFGPSWSSSASVDVTFSAKRWMDGRIWRVRLLQQRSSLEWEFNSREEAIKKVVVIFNGVGASRGVLKP